MGSRVILNKLGARFSVATLTAQLALGSLSLGVMPTIALADSNGPNSPSTTSNDTTVGTVNFSSLSNATASDDARATASLAGSAVSRYLKAQSFGFSIPNGSTINGITVQVERRASSDGAISDNSIRIVKGGTIGSTNKASAAYWATGEAIVSYGGASDLWGETWTAADINASTFGVVVSAKRDSGGGNRTAEIDHVKITVDYTPAAPTTLTVNGSITNDNGGTLTLGGVTLQIDAGTVRAAQ